MVMYDSSMVADMYWDGVDTMDIGGVGGCRGIIIGDTGGGIIVGATGGGYHMW